jgi:hypothetical protein
VVPREQVEKVHELRSGILLPTVLVVFFSADLWEPEHTHTHSRAHTNVSGNSARKRWISRGGRRRERRRRGSRRRERRRRERRRIEALSRHST